MTAVILTEVFPYPPGETFVGPEMQYWDAAPFETVLVAPSRVGGQPRALPARLVVDQTLARRRSRMHPVPLLRALLSPLTWREVAILIRSGKFNLRALALVWVFLSDVLEMRDALRTVCRAHGRIDLAYAYWNEVPAFAALLLKREGLIRCVVTRAHRYDLYEGQRKGSYLPLKRQMLHEFDGIYALSESARTYLLQTYAAPGDTVHVQRLGVTLARVEARPAGSETLRVLSVSRCVRVKRLDRMIGALSHLARTMPEIEIRWTHVGDGPLRAALEADAARARHDLPNLTIDFRGPLAHDDVQRLFLEEPVDLILNTSDSEGVPVSLMEAMSAGVPAVATEVGGVESLVDETCGVLLPAGASDEEIARTIARHFARLKQADARRAARQRVADRFDAAKNYPAFIQHVAALCR